MKGKRIGYGDEVTSGMAKDVRDTSQLEPGARERFATGKNSTGRHKTKNTPPGKKGHKGMPE